jgi:hypothetical protein
MKKIVWRNESWVVFAPERSVNPGTHNRTITSYELKKISSSYHTQSML